MHTQAAIEAILAEGWVRDIQWYSQIDSTNSAARQACSQSAATQANLPALFVADKQTAGRGRQQRSWWSPSGCLMLTLAVGPQSLPVEQHDWCQLALVSGLAVANTVARFVDSSDVYVKWPNDVYVKGKKIAGILIESDAKVWLIGIGLNVCMNWSDAPAEVASKATCISASVLHEVEPAVVLVELMDELRETLTAWQAGQLAWLEAWHQRCLLAGRVIHARLSEHQQVVGVCEGVDQQGRLIVRDESRVHFLTAGEVVAWQ